MVAKVDSVSSHDLPTVSSRISSFMLSKALFKSPSPPGLWVVPGLRATALGAFVWIAATLIGTLPPQLQSVLTASFGVCARTSGTCYAARCVPSLGLGSAGHARDCPQLKIPEVVTRRFATTWWSSKVRGLPGCVKPARALGSHDTSPSSATTSRMRTRWPRHTAQLGLNACGHLPQAGRGPSVPDGPSMTFTGASPIIRPRARVWPKDAGPMVLVPTLRAHRHNLGLRFGTVGGPRESAPLSGDANPSSPL